MNLLLIKSEELGPDGIALLTDRRFVHLRQVLKVTVGQELRAAIERCALGVATVVELQGDRVAVRFRATSPAIIPKLQLTLALPRPKALSRMIQSAASFGVRSIDIINAWRVDACYFESHKLEPTVLANDARLGCEQGAVPYVPDVTVHRFFAEFVEGVLGPRVRREVAPLLLVGHPSEETFPSEPIERAMVPSTGQDITLVIGPDGGFIARELESLIRVGASLVHFGSTVLRSENALVAGLSQIALIRRQQSENP